MAREAADVKVDAQLIGCVKVDASHQSCDIEVEVSSASRPKLQNLILVNSANAHVTRFNSTFQAFSSPPCPIHAQPLPLALAWLEQSDVYGIVFSCRIDPEGEPLPLSFRIEIVLASLGGGSGIRNCVSVYADGLYPFDIWHDSFGDAKLAASCVEVQ